MTGQATGKNRKNLSYVGEMGEKPWVMSPGSTYHESIDKWEEVDGLWVARRAKAPSRVKPPEIENWGRTLEKEYWKTFRDLYKLILKAEGREGLSLWQTPSELVDSEASEASRNLQEMWKERELLINWEATQLQRMVHGWGPFPGRHYMYHHFGWIESNEKQKMIQPNFRVADEWGWRMFEKAINDKTGILAIKRRRFGFTWLLVWLMMHEMCLLNGKVFFTTHSDGGIDNFVDRMRMAEEKLPLFMKPHIMKNAHDTLAYMPNLFVSYVLGRNPADMSPSFLRTASPRNESGFTGTGTSIFAIDEVGEMRSIRDVLAWGTPMLMDDGGFYRSGALIMFGTVGKMKKAGKYVKTLKDNPSTYDFKPYLVKGYMGVQLDPMGNDLKEKFLADREAKLQSFDDAGWANDSIALRQKYPMTWDDAFLNMQGKAVWPSHILAVMRDAASVKQSGYKYGRFYREGRQVKFREEEPVPHPNKDKKDWLGYGQYVIREWKLAVADSFENYYVSTSDPVDFDKDKYQQSEIRYLLSDIAYSVYRRFEFNGSPPQVVAEYCGRPDDLDEAYDQILLGSIYYGAKNNIERQKGGRLIAYYKGYEHLLGYGTGTLLGLTPSDATVGFSASESWYTLGISAVKNYLLTHGSQTSSTIRMCDEALSFLTENTDLVITWIGNILYDTELTAREARGAPREKSGQNKSRISPWTVKDGVVVNRNYGLPKELRTTR